MRASLVAACAMLLGGCAPDFLPSTLLAEFRLLAVSANPAEPGFGETTTLTVLWDDPQGRTPSFTWSQCPTGSNVVGSTFVSDSCVALQPTDGSTGPADGGAPLQPLGTGPSVQLTMPSTIPALLELARQSPPDSTNGIYVPVRLDATVRGDGGSDGLFGIYRVRVHLPLPAPYPQNAPNHNPQVTAIAVVPKDDTGLVDGGPRDYVPDMDPAALDPLVTPLPEGSDYAWSGLTPLPLRALFAPGAAENYRVLETLPPDSVKSSCNVIVLGGDGGTVTDGGASSITQYDCPVTETVSARWYSTYGKITNAVTGLAYPDTALRFGVPADTKEKVSDSDKQNFPLPPSGTRITVFAVGHDERNGNSWLIRTLRIP